MPTEGKLGPEIQMGIYYQWLTASDIMFLIQLSKLFVWKLEANFFLFSLVFFSWQPLRIFLVYSIINLHVKIKIWQPYRKMQCLQLKSILFFQLALSNTWLVGKLSVNILVVDSIYNRKRQQNLRLLEKNVAYKLWIMNLVFD